MLTAHGATHPGRRPVNEDTFLSDAPNGIFIVADGMGGHNAGEIASTLAVDTMRKFLARTLQEAEFTWPFGVDPALSYHANWLLTAMKLANRRVCRQSETREDYTGMGTTIVCAVIVDGTMTYSSVGDSRIYVIRESAVEQITEDDSWVATLAAGNLDSDPLIDSLQQTRTFLPVLFGQVTRILRRPAFSPLRCQEGVAAHPERTQPLAPQWFASQSFSCNLLHCLTV